VSVAVSVIELPPFSAIVLLDAESVTVWPLQDVSSSKLFLEYNSASPATDASAAAVPGPAEANAVPVSLPKSLVWLAEIRALLTMLVLTRFKVFRSEAKSSLLVLRTIVPALSGKERISLGALA
jgi:hypothetical protein